jgi:23S rRNA (adenine2503-C2)-methyltransferase
VHRVERIQIQNYTLPELEEWVESIGERRFRARQVFRNIYARRIGGWEECSDLSKAFRVQLEFGAHLHALNTLEVRESSDQTRKYLFELADGLRIESVLIPDPPRYTLCLSSQVGCALGCRFCLTGTMGLRRNLSSAEIVDQVCRVQDDLGAARRISNLVFMGMGEPLANIDAVVRAIQILTDPMGLAFSHRRITLSTSGLVPQMARLGKETPVNLAVSLHAAENALRSELMPVNRAYPLDQLIRACRDYPTPPRKRITFEYILLEGVNDSTRDARELVKLLQPVRSKVNLMPFNPYEGSPFGRPAEARILAFQEVLHKAQLTAIIRESRGADIGAACGQLVARAGRTGQGPGRRT